MNIKARTHHGKAWLLKPRSATTHFGTPGAWMAEVNGFLVDLRDRVLEVQQVACIPCAAHNQAVGGLTAQRC
jgi:hypothetical protein